MDPSQVPTYVMSTLCRICTEKRSQLTPIHPTLALKIYKCLSIRVNELDHLPLNVCDSCSVKIEDSYHLYETAHRADERLKKLWKILIKETMTNYPNVKIDRDKKSGDDILVVNSTTPVELTNESQSQNLPTNITEILVDRGGCNGVMEEVIVLDKSVTLEIVSAPDCDTAETRNEDNGGELFVGQLLSEEVLETNKSTEVTENDKVYQCQFCSCQLTTLSSLSAHESTHSEGKPYLCDTCGKSFKHANNLRRHSKTHLSVVKKYVCKVCTKSFVTNFFLQEHMNSHTGETPYKCLNCGKEFREKIHLRQHKWTHSNQKFTCPICGNKFNRKGNMKEHIKKYHKNRSGAEGEMISKKLKEGDLECSSSFTCPACGCDFPNQILLKHHLKSHPEQKRFFCSICGKRFQHSGSLTYHRRTAHTGERPFQCSYCDKKFSLRSVQIIHERKTHTFERPYKCSFCSRVFTNSSSLKNHLYVHSKTKMFECDECGKKFSRKSNLIIHQKLHSGDRRFTCYQCGKSYIQKHDLLKHQKIHDPKSKPFFCKYCGNSFSLKKDSSKHAMCQFEFLRKNTSETCAAEKILDSVTNSLERSGRSFFTEDEEELILESVEKLSGEEVVRGDGNFESPETLQPPGV